MDQPRLYLENLAASMTYEEAYFDCLTELSKQCHVALQDLGLRVLKRTSSVFPEVRMEWDRHTCR